MSNVKIVWQANDKYTPSGGIMAMDILYQACSMTTQQHVKTVMEGLTYESGPEDGNQRRSGRRLLMRKRCDNKLEAEKLPVDCSKKGGYNLTVQLQ
jgi:hypothetical protein